MSQRFFGGARRRILQKKIKNGFKFPNYSVEWISLLEKIPIDQQSLEFLHSLLALFESTRTSNFRYPVSFPPPKELPDIASRSVISNNKVSLFKNASQNIFALLVDDESSDEENNEGVNKKNDEDKPSNIPTPEMQPTPSPTALNFQTRYIRIMIIVLIADCMRPDAVPEPTSPVQYEEVQQNWTAVYNFYELHKTALQEWFDHYQENIDRYNRDETVRLYLRRNHHDQSQFHYVLHNFFLSLKSSEKKKAQAIKDLKNHLQSRERELHPMVRERNSVKQIVGEKKWKSNPHPKGDHAARRRALEEEIALIQHTIEVLSSLQFTSSSLEDSVKEVGAM